MLSSAVLWQFFPVFCLAVRTLFCIVWGVFPVFYPLCIRGCLVRWSNRKVRIRYHQRSFLWNPTLRCIPGCTFGLPCFIGYLLTGSVVFCAAAVSDFLTLLCPLCCPVPAAACVCSLLCAPPESCFLNMQQLRWSVVSQKLCCPHLSPSSELCCWRIGKTVEVRCKTELWWEPGNWDSTALDQGKPIE